MKRILFFIVCVSLLFAGIAKTEASDQNAKLIQAIKNGNLAGVDAALKEGADINTTNYGFTPLIWASSLDNWEAAKLLIEKGADVNAKYTDGWAKSTDYFTALYWASKYDNADIVRLLIEKGAIVNETNGAYALMKAKEKGYTDIVQMLEKAGAKENIDAYNTVAQRNLMSAAIAQEAYWIDNKTYTDSLDRLAGSQYGLYIDKGVTIQIISVVKDQYHMIAFHEKGDKKYQLTGPRGRIEQYLK
jgi:ankyrin repeat protein